jgi:hypothetical protein
VFFAQEREITLTWSIAEKYIGHFFCKGTKCSGIFFSPFNPSKSKLWVEIFVPFSHQHLIGFSHSFYSKFLSNLVNLHNVSSSRQRIEFLHKQGLLELMVAL